MNLIKKKAFKHRNNFFKSKTEKEEFSNYFLTNRKTFEKKQAFYSMCKKIKYIITVQVKPNNTNLLVSHGNGNIIYSLSAGILKIKSTKKNYKTVYHMVITEFIAKLKELKLRKNVLVRICVPKPILKKTLRRFAYYRNHPENFLEIVRNFSFNGCRPPKSRRKKRKGLRVFK